MDKLTVETTFFRSKLVHLYVFFIYLCTGKSVNTSTDMAGTVKEMSLIKQLLQLKQLGESNRGIARKLPINKDTVDGYMACHATVIVGRHAHRTTQARAS